MCNRSCILVHFYCVQRSRRALCAFRIYVPTVANLQVNGIIYHRLQIKVLYV